MDPTSKLIEIKDSFDIKDIEINNLLPKPFTISNLPDFSTSHLKSRKIDNLDPIYVNTSKYNLLQELKNIYAVVDQQVVRNLNPFEEIGNSIFINRAAVKLANIDAVFKLTGHLNGIVRYTTPGKLTFCDIAGGPGGFSQYILWRFPESRGFGISLKRSGTDVNLDWKVNKLDLKRLTLSYGDDGTGNLYNNWKSFVSLVRESYPLGVNFIVADGGIDVENGGDYERQEFLSSRLILIECLLILSLTATDGNAVIKMFDTVTEISAQLIYILCCSFENVFMFKPISSRPASSEKYIVCKKLRDSSLIRKYANLLEKAADMYNETENVVKIFDTNDMNNAYIKWLTDHNNWFVNNQSRTPELVTLILNEQQEMVDETLSNSPKYDLRKSLILWSLPDNTS